MPEQDGEAGRLREATAGPSPRGKRRKSSRAGKAATSQPKLQRRHPRRPKRAHGQSAPESAVLRAPSPAAVTQEVVDAPVVAADSAPAGPMPHHDAASEPGSADLAVVASEIEIPGIVLVPETAASELPRPAEPDRPEPRRPAAAGRPRRSFVRWATAASIAVACLLASGRFSDTHVSAHAVPEPIRSAGSGVAVAAGPRAGLPPMEVASLASPTMSGPLIAPPAADPAPNAPPVAATIGPSAKERITARDPAAVSRMAKSRQPGPRRERSDIAATPSRSADEADARLAGRGYAPGRYQMPWGTAHLHEDPNSDHAQGPVWDFVASAGAR